MKNKQFFILIILLVIGFASISATLVINGNTKVAANLDDFNVIFIEGFLNGEINEDVIISGDKKTLTFTTNKLTNINDTARIDYNVKNISTQYDGDVTINCTNEANEYVTVTSSFDGQNLPLTSSINMQAQEVKNGYINAELTKPTTEEQEVKITCKIEVSATSRTNYAYSLSFDSNGGSKVDDKIVEYNTSYGELSIPEKEGHTFVGWFNEEDVRVDETTILDTKGNKNLHAKWETNLYELNIVTNEHGTSETNSILIPYGETSQTKIIPNEDYYISRVSCDNGYTVDYDINTIKYGKQDLNIRNNNVTQSGTCNFSFKKGIYRYEYTGSEQEFITPLDGIYKLEIWGAQGGNIDTIVQNEYSSILKNVYGGYGGYSTGNIILNESKKIFINVGGQGQSATYINSNPKGGYNGGGAGGIGNISYWINYRLKSAALSSAGGGGATHIATESGLLKTFKNKKEKVIIVSGGGGGAGLVPVFPGNGGGISGTDSSSYSGVTTKGATQNSGYDFGLGQNGHNSTQATSGDAEGSGGGGGGWYGGLSYQGIETNSDASGSGGSGFIGNSSLISKLMYCYNCAESSSESTKTISTTCTSMTPTTNCSKQGNGYAKITYLGK